MARTRTRRTAAATAQLEHMESAILISGLWLFCIGTLVVTGIRSIL